MATEMFEQGRGKLPWLADTLGVTVDSLVAIRTGWHKGAYSFPEVDSHGKTVGITFRSETGRKWCETGSERAVVLPSRRLPGTAVYVVEGASDTAAMLSRHHNAVGRPSNCGGVDTLRAVLPRYYAGCQVVVMGENDQKARDTREDWPCGHCGTCMLCWPGLAGARIVAEGLRQCGVVCSVAMPPSGTKDLRDMFRVGGDVEDLVFIDDMRPTWRWVNA